MKRILISLGACMWLLTMAAASAHAFSMEARAGIGSVGRSNSDIQSFTAAINTFLYEGKSTDFLVALEMLSFKQPLLIPITGTTSDYDAKAILLSPALRFKFSTSGIWKPYLSLGILAGKITYDIPANESIYFSEDSKSFFGGRLGLGMDVGLGEHYSLGLEYNATVGTPLMGWQGTIYDLSSSNNTTYAINLGLRYHF